MSRKEEKHQVDRSGLLDNASAWAGPTYNNIFPVKDKNMRINFDLVAMIYRHLLHIAVILE